MRLDLSTWEEIDAYLLKSKAVILPVGSTEQHGPLGIIGTDTLCAEAVAQRAGAISGGLVLPVLAYTPAPFNMGFAGTISVTEPVFAALVTEILAALAHHGFRQVYVLNGHGANLEPLRRVAAAQSALDIHIRSWWDFQSVRSLRDALYGSWEGMHATPSEVAITQHTHRIVDHPAIPAPEPLTAEFIVAHAGDRHGPPDEHRRQFPDGRVGSHSGLARPEHGEQLLTLASQACADEFAGLWA
ncbi:creatininase family protein [Devosia epidermidihirudinis]|nr:creatininase family protein [Devosia epidermidihirudinis]